MQIGCWSNGRSDIERVTERDLSITLDPSAILVLVLRLTVHTFSTLYMRSTPHHAHSTRHERETRRMKKKTTAGSYAPFSILTSLFRFISVISRYSLPLQSVEIGKMLNADKLRLNASGM